MEITTASGAVVVVLTTAVTMQHALSDQYSKPAKGGKLKCNNQPAAIMTALASRNSSGWHKHQNKCSGLSAM